MESHSTGIASVTDESFPQANRALLYWNKNARQGESFQHLREEFIASPKIGQVIENKHQLSDILQEDLEQYSAVIAAGGDGTIHKTVNLMLEHNISLPLGIIPLGTGNDLCRSLAIPNQPAEVASALLEGHWKRQSLDLVEVQLDGKTIYMVNVLAAGISAEVSQSITSEHKEVFGPFAYMTGMIKALSAPQTYELQYQLDQKPAVRSECLNFFIANGRMCGGGLEISPESKTDDGILQFVTYLPMSGVDRAMLLTDYLVGRYEEHPAVGVESFQKMTLQSQDEIPLSIDGEIHTCRRLDVTILPSRLQVLIPQITEPAMP